MSVKIGIIGGTGSMGRWFNSFFSNSGHNVLIAGRKTPLSFEELAHQSDIVILSLPLEAAIKLCKEIGPILTKDQLLMDFCSLKEKIVNSMMLNTEAEVIGTHPLFGPFTDSIKGQNVIICKGRGEKWLNFVEDEFKTKGAVVTIMDPVKHDRNMAVVQGLTHILSISLGRTLQKLNISPKEAILFSTPVFRLKIDLIARLFAQDLDLYAGLVGKNEHVPEVFNTFVSSINESAESLIKNNNPITYLEDIRKFLGTFCEDGLKESNEILNTLYSMVKVQ
ncbi:MAG: prephenate dehydrogenase/arogenate dehydrogenase family protein [Desulfobacterales bacterium]|nr:prephenate dehydrogenase/arogenate dehydrogenase family protein [Desulfobacterales bacterium]